VKSKASSKARTKKISLRKNKIKGCPEEKQDYYSKKLSAERLKMCYEIAPPRIRQYLKAEVDFILNKIKPGDIVLELGCGYGRIIPCLASRARSSTIGNRGPRRSKSMSCLGAPAKAPVPSRSR